MKNVRSFSRLFYARAEQCDIDKQGRIRIPSSLAEIAELEKDLVLIGVGSHWEIWDQARWEGYLESHHEAFDQIAESTFDPAQSKLDQPSNSPTADLHESSGLEANRKVSPK